MKTYTITDTPEALSLDFDALPGRIDVLAADASLEEAWALVECDDAEKAAIEAAGLELKLAKPRRYCDSGGVAIVILAEGGEAIEGTDLCGEYSEDDAESAIREAMGSAAGALVIEAPGGGWDVFSAGLRVGWNVRGKFVRATPELLEQLASVRVAPESHVMCACDGDAGKGVCTDAQVEQYRQDLGKPTFPVW